MAIIRDLDENGNLVEPSNRDERIILWNYSYRNTKYLDEMVYYKLVELGMFDSCESFTSSDNNRSNGNYNDSFSLLFSQETRNNGHL